MNKTEKQIIRDTYNIFYELFWDQINQDVITQIGIKVTDPVYNQINHRVYLPTRQEVRKKVRNHIEDEKELKIYNNMSNYTGRNT